MAMAGAERMRLDWKDSRNDWSCLRWDFSVCSGSLGKWRLVCQGNWIVGPLLSVAAIFAASVSRGEVIVGVRGD